MVRRINKVAVFGSGIMGGGIAALLAGAGIKVLLLDIVPFDLKEEEKEDPKARNRIVTAGMQAVVKAKPPLLMHPKDMDLIETAARLTGRSVPLLLGDIAARSAILNRHDRITGDGILHAATRLVRNRRRLGCDGIHEVVAGFASYQTRLPEQKTPGAVLESSDPDSGRVLDVIIDLAAHCRHGL